MKTPPYIAFGGVVEEQYELRMETSLIRQLEIVLGGFGLEREKHPTGDSLLGAILGAERIRSTIPTHIRLFIPATFTNNRVVASMDPTDPEGKFSQELSKLLAREVVAVAEWFAVAYKGLFDAE